MSPLASPTYAFQDNPPMQPYPHPATEARSLLTASWRVLEQTPPPSLREILGAYSARGDGDRDMLLAILTAKTAEDQRLAAVTNLQRTMLESYRSSPPQQYAADAYHYPPPGALASPPLHDHMSPRMNGESYSAPHRHSSNSSLPPLRDTQPSAGPSRKRSRTSRSPRSPYERDLPEHSSHELPLSPYSSARSDSAERSPRSRGAMAIGSLLSSGTKEPIRESELAEEGQGQPSEGPRKRGSSFGHRTNQSQPVAASAPAVSV
ncbi:hypothetical protein JAAARDRAFT_37870 [Jaapia argillacea MUCL 33604]|uniref:Uncharacterized protein n=1 Tax=Jaapia argillacea MUCL 33604 TaxID=933084 RepID=A0A067PWQ3_9AGAM|nr:hypothetical protein JAAARDRAFT_37870 [Jaapia argillacea MUCL 33604]